MKLKIIEKNLTFSEALGAIKEGKWVKVPEWRGYWFLKAGLIRVMNEDGVVLDTPWTKEQFLILREDWQIVEKDDQWEKEQEKLFMDSIKKQMDEAPVQYHPPVTGFSIPTIDETPVQENSKAFEEWLNVQEIEWRPSGHQTLIIGNRDMFEIGRAWGVFKNDMRATERNKPSK